MEKVLVHYTWKANSFGPILVNDMNDTVSNKNVGRDNPGAINENTAVVDCDGQLLAVQGSEFLAIRERRAVADSSIDNYTSSARTRSKGKTAG